MIILYNNCKFYPIWLPPCKSKETINLEENAKRLALKANEFCTTTKSAAENFNRFSRSLDNLKNYPSKKL